MKYNTLLFDADGTLLDFERSEREALIDVLSVYGIIADDELVATYSAINDSLWKLLERGGVTKDELRIERFARLCEIKGYSMSPTELAAAYCTSLATKSYLLDGALEVCRTLSRTHRLYLITNGFKIIQRGRFGGSPLAKYFSGVFISEDVGFEKPAVEYFDAVSAGITDFHPEEALVIGDSLTSDIRGGINAGIDVCWFNPMNKTAPEDMPINYIISDLHELFDVTKQ